MTTRIAATLCVAVALVLPGAAAARPIDDFPIATPAASPEPQTLTVVRDSDDTLPANAYELLVGALARTGSDFATGNVYRLTAFATFQSPFLRQATDAPGDDRRSKCRNDSEGQLRFM